MVYGLCNMVGNWGWGLADVAISVLMCLNAFGQHAI